MTQQLRRLLLAPLVLPHEFAHALPAWLAGLDVRVELLPDWDGRVTPLGRFDAALSPSTPAWLVRTIALAPLALYLALAAGLGAVLRPSSPVAWVAYPLLAAWATLSDGDLAVAADPESARDAGRFLAPTDRRHALVSVALTLGVVVAVALLLLQ